MSATPQIKSSANGLTVSAYPGDGDVLLAFSLDEQVLNQNDLAGFAIQWTMPGGQPQYIPNRLNFAQPLTSSSTPQQRKWVSSQAAPIQKFHWVHFPPEVVPGQYTYKVTARYCRNQQLVDGPSVQVSVGLVPQKSSFEFGFTRGYLTSQAYAEKFGNKDFRPQGPKSLDYDTAPFQAQYEWLGFHARKMVFNLLQECVNDPSTSVDLFAYDLDEPDIVKMLVALGPRLRAFLDNASLHTGKAVEVTAHQKLVQSAGAENVKQGHFTRFAHDKIIIQKRNGKATKVLTGSANFSVRGLYVQANNVLRFDDPAIADLYAQVFESVFANMSGFSGSPLAAKWFPFPSQPGVPNFSVSFSPHKTASVSLDAVANAVKNAKSSVLFAVMELGGGGDVLSQLKQMHASGKVFSYGMTQSESGDVTVYKPGDPGVLVPFAALSKQVPPPFNKETTGGMGQVIHDKFVVVDFNDSNPMVFTGSSNLAAGGETSNGDNLLQITDPVVAAAFAIEAFRLVDHYQFRAALTKATQVQPLQLTACGSTQKWWAKDYDKQEVRNFERQLLALGSGNAGAPPAATTGGSKPGSAVKPAPTPPKKPKPPKKGTKTVKKGAGRKKTTKSVKASARTKKKSTTKKPKTRATKKPAKSKSRSKSRR